jgi:hypothetical protein
VGKPPVLEAIWIRALEGRLIEALVSRPFRAGRVWALISRWFLHRLISSGAEEHFYGLIQTNRTFPFPLTTSPMT